MYLFRKINLESEIYCLANVFAFEKYLVMSGVIDGAHLKMEGSYKAPN